MFQTIVIAMDASEGSDRALPVAEHLARSEGARLVLAHARTHALETEIERALALHVSELQKRGLDARLVVRPSMVGEEADALVGIARDVEADLIVIASRGRGPVAGVLLGSVSQRLLHVAPCPVVVVTPPAEPAVAAPEAPAVTSAG
ncbi:MAG TPA: universal stress protein [Gaiellales bacterium]|nr:universal stress protein [Gaiellales bacterium]